MATRKGGLTISDSFRCVSPIPYFVESDITVGASAQIYQLDVTPTRSMPHTTRGTADAQTVRSHRYTL